MPVLGVNVDHIATLRQARYRDDLRSPNAEPDPVSLARVAEKAGAKGITVHLREDRRHIQESDVRSLRGLVKTSLNLEMAVTPAMISFATHLGPDEACLVPESREEVTTEGGLDVVGQEKKIAAAVRQLTKAGIQVSLFIDPSPAQIEAAARSGAPCIELHTGAYANARTPAQVRTTLARQKKAVILAARLGLQVNAGHGLNYKNTRSFVKAVPGLHTLNIGHSIVSRALSIGFGPAVREMADLLPV